MSGASSPLFVGSAVKRSTIVFNSESDSDSIKTDTTVESIASNQEYDVDRILAHIPNVERGYLVKWQGYPLSEATWESKDSFLGDGSLKEWAAQEKRIASGDAEPFDVESYNRAVEEKFALQASKRQRRNAKRIKRGIPPKDTPPNQSEDEDVDQEDEADLLDDNSASVPASAAKRRASPLPAPNAVKKVKQPEIRRKGVAQRIRKRVVSDTSSSDGSSSDDAKSVDSLQEELLAKASKPKASAKKASTSTSRTETAPPTKSNSAPNKKIAAPVRPTVSVSDTAPAPARKSSITGPGSRTDSATGARSKLATRTPAKAPSSGAGRKSAPTHVAAGPAKKPRDILANWDAPKQRRERVRVSGETPKDSLEPKFTALATQGRYQKYGRENEKAPDFNALTVVDPKTGKTQPPKAQEASVKELPSAYSRRTPPPRANRRSLTPPSPDRLHNLAPAKPNAPVCKFWLTTGCNKAPSDCHGLHPVSRNLISDKALSKRDVTCFFWLSRDACANGSDCPYAHVDTGIYCGPPKSGLGLFTVNFAPIEASPPPLPQPQTSAQQPQHSTAHIAQPSSKPPSTPACRSWLEGRCSNTAETCSWAHALPTESFKGNIMNVPKFQTYCYYMASTGKCTKGDSCPFSHVDTGVQAGPPGRGGGGRTSIVPKRRETEVRARTSSTGNDSGGWARAALEPKGDAQQINNVVSKSEARARNLPPHTLECFFWRTRGNCMKAECEYAHCHTGTWAAPPPGHSTILSGASDSTSASATNSIPVAATRGMFSPDQTTSSNTLANDPEPQPFGSPMEMVGSPAHITQMPPPPREDSSRRLSLSICAKTIPATLTISYSGEQDPEVLQLRLELSELPIYGKLVGQDPRLHVDRVVLASDFRNVVWDDHLRDSECTVGSVAVKDAAAGQRLVDLCKQRTIGLIASQSGKKSKMLIYPPSDDVWKFMDTGTSWKTDAALRFRLFSEIPGCEEVASALHHLHSPSDKRPASVLVGEEIVGLDSTRMLPDRKTNQRAVFIMFPPTHHAELDFYAKFFGAQKYQVYHAGIAGAWQYFLQSHDKKVVIHHPDVQLWQIPGLKPLIWSGTSFFSIGHNRLESLDDFTFTCERFFPFATAVLITDDVFIHHPEKALDVLNGFITAHKGKPEYKLVARPGVKEWLSRLADDSFRGRQDDRWLRLYDAICRLCTPEDEDPFDPPNPHPDTNLVSLSPELLPDYDSLWTRDQASATDFLVNWFASWSIENVRKLRKMYVFHEPKGGFRGTLDDTGKWVQNDDPRGWSKMYNHIWFQKPEDIFTSMKK